MTDEKIIKYKNSLKGRYTGMTEKIATEIGLPKKKVEKKEDKIDIDSMDKDELNDYAVGIGLTKEVNTSMKKQEMVDIIKKYKEGEI